MFMKCCAKSFTRVCNINYIKLCSLSMQLCYLKYFEVDHDAAMHKLKFILTTSNYVKKITHVLSNLSRVRVSGIFLFFAIMFKYIIVL